MACADYATSHEADTKTLCRLLNIHFLAFKRGLRRCDWFRWKIIVSRGVNLWLSMLYLQRYIELLVRISMKIFVILLTISITRRIVLSIQGHISWIPGVGDSHLVSLRRA